MSDALTTLLEVQDLRSKLREMQDETSQLGAVEETHFNVDPAVFREQLEAKIAALVEALEPKLRRRYDQVAGRLDRVVVPVINGVCYGCFVSIATAHAGEEKPNETLRTCESCGRFIYVLV